MKKLVLAALLLLAQPTLAQQQPATLSITPNTQPEVLQVLDNTGTWVPVGNVDPQAHIFHPQNGFLSVMDYGASGSAQTTSATCNGATLSLGAPQDFANGEGVMLFGCGPPFSAAPPAVTASVVGTAGSTVLNYAVASVDGAGGVGVPVGTSVSTAPATLNAQNYVSLAITPGAGATAYVIWKQVGSGSWYYLGSGQAATYVDTGLQSQDQSPGCLSYALRLRDPWNRVLRVHPDELAADSPSLSQCGLYRPWWVPAQPPVAAQNDWLVSQITGGGGSDSLAISPPAQQAVATTLRHDDTAAIQTCLNSGLPPAKWAGAPCYVPCGNFLTSAALVVPQASGLQGARKLCVAFTWQGTSDFAQIVGSRAFLRDLYVNATGQTAAGWCVNAANSAQLAVAYLECDHPYSGVRLFDWNNWTFEHVVIERFYSQQGSLVAMLTDAAGNTCCGDMIDVYGYSDGTLGDYSTGQAAFLHDGNINTVICRNCASSDIAGSGLVARNTVGAPANEPQFLQYTDYASEYATARNVDILSGIHIELHNPTVHTGGSYNFVSCAASNALHVGPNASQVQIHGGFFQAATGDGVYLEGQETLILGAQIMWNSNANAALGGTAGQCNGVEFAGTAKNNALVASTLGDHFNPTWQKYPAVLDSGATQNAIALNPLAGNVNSTVLDQSGNATNGVVFNPGDTAPALWLDYAHTALGIGTTTPYLYNTAPGLMIRCGATIDCRESIQNTMSGNSTATLQLTNQTGGAYTTIIGQNNSGTNPRFVITPSSIMTGGAAIDASAAGAASALVLKGGATAGVQATPSVSCSGAPTASFVVSNGVVTHC
jgi:hypothetical protein